MKALIIAVLAIMVGVALGTLFSQVYPTIEIDGDLDLLFGVNGLFIVLGGHAVCGTIKRDKT